MGTIRFIDGGAVILFDDITVSIERRDLETFFLSNGDTVELINFETGYLTLSINNTLKSIRKTNDKARTHTN